MTRKGRNMTPDSATVRSPIGEVSVDVGGTSVGVVRMDPAKSYSGLPELLQRVIDEDDSAAWAEIKAKADYTFDGIDHALGPLAADTDLSEHLRAELAKGKKLLFKPNLVSVMCIDSAAHGEGMGYSVCTSWIVVAAVMRWFHDKLDVSYHQMALGEAATMMDVAAGHYRIALGKPDVTTEAVLEGKLGDGLYGGWGFYFARRYLAENHLLSHSDDPMKGYEDSLTNNYVPPGKAVDRLPVYDLNAATNGRGRKVKVPNGVNFRSIVLHKAVVGGDPADAADGRDYPGCMLVNMPKLKVHDIALFTNAIKNLGIGLYPMDAPATPGGTDWLYAAPQGRLPGMKASIPHEVWFPELEPDGVVPKRKNGGFVVKKTGGMPGTMADVIEAAVSQGVFIINAVDAIETTNLTNTEGVTALKVQEGMFFAGLDLLAVDLACARYMFKTVPLAEARRVQFEGALPSDFLQRQPLPTVEGLNIVTKDGYDSPISRYNAFDYIAKRGLGKAEYHVVGRDVTSGKHLVSIQGHLGAMSDGEFAEVMTETMYFGSGTVLWDLQAMSLAYADANDKLTGSSVRRQYFEAFDDNGDGIIDYDELGRNGVVTGPLLTNGGVGVSSLGTDEHGSFRARFLMGAGTLRLSNPVLNNEGLAITDVFLDSAVGVLGMMLSQLEMEGVDPFFPTMTWGKGKWPSIQLARFLALGAALYGQEYPLGLNISSLYGAAFQYADRYHNGGQYTSDVNPLGEGVVIDSTPLSRYVDAVTKGAAPLPFVFYVPPGYTDCGGAPVPNVEATDDPVKVLHAVFAGGEEVW
jgi:Domain of unknown function (DUF362)